MGDKDRAAKDFFKLNEVFADAFNGYFFGGKRVLKPSDLTPADTVNTLAYESLECGTEFSERIRDVLKRAVIHTDGHARYVLLGIESQSKIDPGMVIRCLEYDARTYREQMDVSSKKEHSAIKVPGASNLQLNDNAPKYLCPVISLVIYMGSDKWNAPKTLHEMFGRINNEPHPFAQFAPDYQMHLIEPYQMNGTDFDVFSTNLREFLLVMKASRDSEALTELFEKEERLTCMDCEAVALINACTGAGIHYNETQRKVDMRSAFVEVREQWFAQGKVEGKAEGIEKGRAEGKAEGMERGRAEGKAEGMERGRAEGRNQEKLAIALRMLTEDLLDVPTIAKVTGLTLQQVQALQTAK